MPGYPSVPKERIIEFFREKGFIKPDDEPFLVFTSNPYQEVILIDEEADMIDLNHLVDDWTVQGAGQLAEELLMWLGMHPIA